MVVWGEEQWTGGEIAEQMVYGYIKGWVERWLHALMGGWCGWLM